MNPTHGTAGPKTKRTVNKLFLAFAALCGVFFVCGCAREGRQAGGKSTLVDVYVIPLDDFNFAEASRAAQAVSRETGLRIKTTVNMGSAGLKPLPGTQQFSGEDIIEAAQQVIANLPEKHTDSAFIVLTRRDINIRERGPRFLFAMQSRSQRTAVVSSARLVFGTNGRRIVDDETIRKRIKKMVKRQIGDVYYGYPRSTDIANIMYAPLLSLNDVDRLGWKFPESR